MPIKHFSVIFNPIAGKGKAEKTLPIIKQFLSDNSLDHKIFITNKIGHATTLAEDLCNDPDTAIIAAGGDGTINEVINGLMLTKSKKAEIDPIFGVLAIGCGNDFAFGAGVPTTLADCLNLLLKIRIKPIDVGLIKGGDFPGGRYFGNGIGIGFDTIVGLEAAKLKHFHGSAGYMISALKTLITNPVAPEIEIELNEKKQIYTPALVSIMNGRRMGGSFFMAPDAENDDNLLNLCMTNQGTRRKLLRTMFHYTKGTQRNLDNTIIALISSITLKAVKGTMAVHADGETICKKGKYLEISCIHKALNLIR